MELFNEYLPQIENYLNEARLQHQDEDMLHSAFQYNVPAGKTIRGRMVPLAFRALCPDAPQTEIDLANKVGWVIQIHQAFILMIDDIMDQSETRRGKPCWYRVKNRNLAACNDGLYLEHASYQLLHRFLGEDPELYTATIQLFLDVTYKITLGQDLDMETGLNYDNFDTYTMDKYKFIAKNKTGVFFCYQSICTAMLLAGMRKEKDETGWALVEDICLDIGFFAQVMDDYLDCFGDPQKTGKDSTDIQNGKCTWLFAKSMEICSNNVDFEEEWSNLKKQYGQSDEMCTKNVKNLYAKLGIQKEHDKIQNQIQDDIGKKVGALPRELKGLGKFLQGVFNDLCDRKK